MPYLKTEAISLKRADYSETSQLITFYSRDFGKLSCIAKGARRPKTRFQGGVDLLNQCEIVFLESRSGGLSTLTECTVKNQFPGLRRRLPHFYAANFLAELVLLATFEGDPNPQVYLLLLDYLKGLAGLDRTQELTLSFVLKLLELLGTGPALEACCLCGKKIPPRGRVSFQAQAGGVICLECGNSMDTLPIMPGSLAALRHLTKSSPQAVAKTRLSDTMIEQVREAGLSCVNASVGRLPVSSKYLVW